MFLTNQQARERLSSEKNLANRFGNEKQNDPSPVSEESKTPEVIEKKIRLAGNDKKHLSKQTRTEIAIRARSGETQEALAREYDISQPNVSHIATSKTKGINEEQVEQKINEVKDLALSRLMTSLGLLTEDKLSGCSAKDLSVIASNMGRVVEKTTPKESTPDGLTFIIYSPELKNEKAYDSLEI